MTSPHGASGQAKFEERGEHLGLRASERSYIYCSDVFKIYNVAELEVVALRGLDLKVEKGEIVAIIGASGSGKSTLLNILAGYDVPSAGTVYVGGYDLLNMNADEVVRYRRHEVGFVWQQTARNLFGYLTAQENVELPMILAGKDGDKMQSRAKELLDMVGLGHRLHHRPENLSGGEQQRVAIAVALANDPPLLLADEPTGELDDETGAELLALFNDLNVELNTTIVIVTHDPAVSTSVGRAIAMRDGKTATEIRRAVEDERRIGGTAVDLQEYLLVDTSGRIQIPREVMDQLRIGERMIVEVDEGRVTLRRADV